MTITFRGSAADFDSTLSLLLWTLVGCGLAGGLIAALVARLIANRCLSPLRQAADVIGTIDERALDRRIDLNGLPPEMKPMADRLNEMLALSTMRSRVAGIFWRTRRMKLRTPIAAMRTTLEVSLRRSRDAESYRQTIDTTLADARLMHSLVESLMTQSACGAHRVGRKTPADRSGGDDRSDRHEPAIAGLRATCTTAERSVGATIINVQLSG